MAQIGDIQQNADGIFKLTPQGWQEIPREQAEAETLPAASRFIGAVSGLPTGGEAAALGQLSVLAGLGGPFAALGTRGVRGAISQRIGRNVAAAREGGGQLIRRPSNVLGRATTAGSAARLVEAGAEAVPGLNIFGLAQKAVNQRRINASFVKAAGGSDDLVIRARAGVTEDIMDDLLTGFNQNFRKVEDGISKSVNQVTARSAFDLAKEQGFVAGKLAKVVDKTDNITGKEIMALRSELASVMRSNESFLVKNQARAQIEVLDEMITESLQAGDEALQALYQETRARWRVWANAQKGASISADGQINPRSMRAALARNMGDNFRAGRPLAGAPDEVNDYLSIIREGAALDVGLPSSGTAERAAGAAVLGGIGLGAL